MVMKVDPAKKWTGPVRSYDIIKEGVIALVVVAILAGGLSLLFSSPDDKAVTLKSWSNTNAPDFVVTATGELAGTTTSAGYGAPYNHAAKGPTLGPLKLQDWVGVHIPINPANDFVVMPLLMLNDANATAAVDTWRSASADEQTKWATTYADALSKASGATSVVDSKNEFGPVPTMVASLLGMAKTGALDGALTTSETPLPTDFTKPLLFLADSEGYFAEMASKQHLGGDQWGVMNETGSWPGQSWLWLFSFWYQVEPFKSSGNADTLVMTLMGLLTVSLALIPIFPFIRKLPYKIPIHRLIWKKWYARKL
jgi:hypothetical protein